MHGIAILLLISDSVPEEKPEDWDKVINLQSLGSIEAKSQERLNDVAVNNEDDDETKCRLDDEIQLIMTALIQNGFKKGICKEDYDSRNKMRRLQHGV